MEGVEHGGQDRLLALLESRLPAELEARLERLDRLSGETAVSFEDMGRRASGALTQILVQGRDVETVLARLAASLSNQILRQVVAQPITGLLEAAVGSLTPTTTAFSQRPGASGNSNITINVSAPGGDPAQVRRSMGRAASELARVVAQGRRYQ